MLGLVIRLDIIRKIEPHSSETHSSHIRDEMAEEPWQNLRNFFGGKSLWSLFPLMFLYILSYLFIFDMISTVMEISDDALKKKKKNPVPLLLEVMYGQPIFTYSISQLARLKVISIFLSNMHQEVREWTEVFECISENETCISN